MAKNQNNPPKPPAPEPGAATPAVDLGADPLTGVPPVDGQPPEDPTLNPPEGDAPDPQPPEVESPLGAPPLLPGIPCRFRVNWRFEGFREDPLEEGEEVEATEDEAAPYMGRGGVLTRLED